MVITPGENVEESFFHHYSAFGFWAPAVQDYVDMAISSTINMPSWGTEHNNEDRVLDFAHVLAKYAPRLRGFTAYPDGARGGQPLTYCSYKEAKKHKGVTFEDNVDASCGGGVCGI